MVKLSKAARKKRCLGAVIRHQLVTYRLHAQMGPRTEDKREGGISEAFLNAARVEGVPNMEAVRGAPFKKIDTLGPWVRAKRVHGGKFADGVVAPAVRGRGHAWKWQWRRGKE